MTAASRRESQEEILEAALASLTDADIPPADDELYGWPDPDFDRPAALAGLDGAELEELATDASVPAVPAWPLRFQSPTWPEAWPAGFGPRDGSGDGPGFADGGVLDVLAAGLPLAGFAADAHDRLVQVTDDELVGVLRAWRRVTSWAAASELAAVAELARRRPADGSPPAAPGRLPLNVSEFVPEEVAAALTLTGRAAQDEVTLALDLGLPAGRYPVGAGRRADRPGQGEDHRRRGGHAQRGARDRGAGGGASGCTRSDHRAAVPGDRAGRAGRRPGRGGPAAGGGFAARAGGLLAGPGGHRQPGGVSPARRRGAGRRCAADPDRPAMAEPGRRRRDGPAARLGLPGPAARPGHRCAASLPAARRSTRRHPRPRRHPG